MSPHLLFSFSFSFSFSLSFSPSPSSSGCSQASHSFGFWPISRLLLPAAESKRCGNHVPVRMASSTKRWWRRRRIKLRITMADDTARRRTRVATSAVYDTFVGIREVPVRGLAGEAMVERNEERSKIVVVVRDQGARRLPRKVYTVGGKVGVCEVDMWGKRSP